MQSNTVQYSCLYSYILTPEPQLMQVMTPSILQQNTSDRCMQSVGKSALSGVLRTVGLPLCVGMLALAGLCRQVIPLRIVKSVHFPHSLHC